MWRLTESLSGAVMTSVLAPLQPLVDWLLPDGVEMLGVTGGVQVSRPIPD